MGAAVIVIGLAISDFRPEMPYFNRDHPRYNKTCNLYITVFDVSLSTMTIFK